MNGIDISVGVLYFVAVIIIGVIATFKNSTKDELFLANKQLHWFPLGISVMVSAFTAVNLLSFPKEIMNNGPAVLISLPLFLIILIPIIKLTIPFYRKQSSLSAYSFLETRYAPRVKLLASLLFILWRLIWIAVMLYAAGTMIVIATGLPLIPIVAVTGIVVVLYASYGGFRAVIYTDTLQFLVLFGTVITAIAFALSRGVLSMESTLTWVESNPLPSDFLSFDPTIRITLWSGLIGTFISFFARYGADQITIQRYMAARSEKEAIKSITLNAIAALSVLSLLLFFGITLSLVGESSGVSHLPPIKQMTHYFSSLPKGLLGLFFAALLAATMSSIDSGINAISGVIQSDFKRLFSKFSGQVISLILGSIAIITTIALVPLFQEDRSLFVTTNKIIHGFGGPILALVLAGMLSKRSTTNGVFWGTILGSIFSVFSILKIEKLALHYYSVLNFIVTVLAISLLSLILKEKRDTI